MKTKAIYEAGVLKPQEKMGLKEGEEIELEYFRNAEIDKAFDVQDKKAHKKLVTQKTEVSWVAVMKETRGAWREHPVFKDKGDAVEIVNWMRGKE
ncbi:MAG: antitoxin family protein [Methanosarcinales archaeon]